MRRFALVAVLTLLSTSPISRTGVAQVVVPQVRAGTPTIRGTLSAEVVRRIVARHLNEVRFCYERGLVQQPEAKGRVVVEFVVAPTGDVPSSRLVSSTTSMAVIDDCIVAAARRWQFPALAGGGIVVVAQPFTLLIPPSPRRHGLGSR